MSDAKEIYRQVFSEIDLLFAGVEDFACLFQCPSPDLIVQNLAEYKIDEIIVKNGSFDIWYVTQDQHQILPVTPVERVVDTTSAGDSFNGVYLGARLKGRLPDEAIRLAAACAALVIQHSGAIIAPELIDDFKKSLDSST